MTNISRRKLMTSAAALGGAIASSPTGNAQLVYRRNDWKADEFQELLRKSARFRQVFDVVAINDGRFLNNIKNALNGFEFGFGVAPNQVQIVAGLHGPSNLVNYDDTIWAKYKVGEWLGV